MASLLPFPALRPRADVAARVNCPPYDVMNEDEARRMVADEPMSFLCVTRPESLFAPGIDSHSDAVYARGAELFAELQKQGMLVRDAAPTYSVYRLTWRERSQTGLVALASIDEYRKGIVRKHELTRPDKEDDRTRHITELRAQTGPVFCAYCAGGALDGLLAEAVHGAPDINFETPDHVRHELWTISDQARISQIKSAASTLDCIYICDGHHRAAAGSRAAEAFTGPGAPPLAQHLLTVTFPHDQCRILPYHRVLSDLNGMTMEETRQAIDDCTEGTGWEPSTGEPLETGEFAFYLGDRWSRRRFRDADRDAARDAAERLDCSLMQRIILTPLFGIDDPRTNPRIRFVGGIKGALALEHMVHAGEAPIAFSMAATPMADLLAVADANLLMPPKSTWFEPKLRDGLFVHAW